MQGTLGSNAKQTVCFHRYIRGFDLELIETFTIDQIAIPASKQVTTDAKAWVKRRTLHEWNLMKLNEQNVLFSTLGWAASP